MVAAQIDDSSMRNIGRKFSPCHYVDTKHAPARTSVLIWENSVQSYLPLDRRAVFKKMGKDLVALYPWECLISVSVHAMLDELVCAIEFSFQTEHFAIQRFGKHFIKLRNTAIKSKMPRCIQGSIIYGKIRNPFDAANLFISVVKIYFVVCALKIWGPIIEVHRCIG